jgi:hypothetical protein
MSDSPENDDAPRTKPTDRGWTDAKRDVADRNDEARKAGKQRKDDHDRQIANMKKRSKAER